MQFRPSCPTAGPQGCLSDAEKRAEQLEKTNENLKRQIMDFQEVQKQIRMLADYFRIRADKYEVLGNLPQTEHVFFVSGYIPEKYGAAVEKELTGRYEAVVERTQIDEEEEAPVLLQNNSFASSVEGVISAFWPAGKRAISIRP